MRLAYLTVIILALIINVIARLSNAKGASHLKAMERLVSGGDEKDMRSYLILLGFLEDYAVKRKYSIVALCLFLHTLQKIVPLRNPPRWSRRWEKLPHSLQCSNKRILKSNKP